MASARHGMTTLWQVSERLSRAGGLSGAEPANPLRSVCRWAQKQARLPALPLRFAGRRTQSLRHKVSGCSLAPFSVIVAQQFAGFSRRVPPGHERETRPRSDAFRDAIERRLPELFREAGRVRRMREVPDSPPIGVATTVCLRAVLLLLLLFILTSLAMPLLLGAFIQLMSQ